MSWSNITELRGLVETQISDSTLQDILDIAQRYIESRVGVQLNPSYEIQSAHLFKSAALTLKRMKQTANCRICQNWDQPNSIMKLMI